MKLLCIYFLSFFLLSAVAHSQDPASLMSEGRKLEQKLKDEDAIEKYKQAAFIQPSNQPAILKCAELSCVIGARQQEPDKKIQYYKEAYRFAETAFKLDSNKAQAHYMMAVVYGKLTEVEKKNEALVNYTKQIKHHADKAVQLDPAFARAYHVLGKWHLEMVSLSGVKKAALKMVYGGVGEATIDKAISNMEQCRTMEPYYCPNFYDLARAYQFNKQYEKAIQVLEQLKKLPTRRQEDAEVKEKGAVLLLQLQ
jgi:tetratricopeptide (TPR) repeat protein